MRTLNCMVAAAALGVCSIPALAVPVTNGLVYHLDASDLDGDGSAEGFGESGLDGSLVTTWVDKATADGQQTAFQASTANQPGLQTETLNGLPVVRFDGTDDFLKSANFNAVIPQTQVFLVWKADSTGGPISSIAFDSNDGTNRNAIVYENVEGTRIGSYAGGGGSINNYTAPTAFEEPIYLTGTFNINGPGMHNIRINGVEAVNNTTGAGLDAGQGLNGVTVGARFGECCGDANLSLDGYIGEMLIYDVPLSEGDRDAVEAYLSNKWFEPIPEPSALALVGLAGLAMLRRRR